MAVSYPEPNFFIIGAARSGTTALVEMLRQHPDVFITDPKEPNFLALANTELDFKGPGDDVMIERYSVTDPARYSSLYRGTDARAARGDASTSSLYYSRATLDNLNRYFPDARLVVILREPVARAFSAFSYLRMRGFEPHADFLGAVKEEREGLRADWHHLWHYVEMGRYARQLKPFIERLGPDQVKVLFYDDLCRKPLEVARSTFSFLGVDPGVKVTSQRVNVSGEPRSVTFQRAIGRMERGHRIRSATRVVVPYRLSERLKRLNLHHQQIPRDVAEALGPAFRSEMSELADLLVGAYPDIATCMPTWLQR
jgi:hypothetical protein